MNTRINYLYRDASNYKVHNTAVIRGELSEEDQKTILWRTASILAPVRWGWMRSGSALGPKTTTAGLSWSLVLLSQPTRLPAT